MPRRGGRRWRNLRAAILTTSDICAECGQPGADQVDHIIPVHLRPDLEYDPANLRPYHGRKTPGCRGNLSRGAIYGNQLRKPNVSRAW